MAELRKNTWSLNQWYDQDVAGNAGYEASGKLWSWGYNYYGMLGQNDGANAHRSSPVQIGSETTWDRHLGSGNSVAALKKAEY